MGNDDDTALNEYSLIAKKKKKKKTRTRTRKMTTTRTRTRRRRRRKMNKSTKVIIFQIICYILLIIQLGYFIQCFQRIVAKVTSITMMSFMMMLIYPMYETRINRIIF